MSLTTYFRRGFYILAVIGVLAYVGVLDWNQCSIDGINCVEHRHDNESLQLGLRNPHPYALHNVSVHVATCGTQRFTTVPPRAYIGETLLTYNCSRGKHAVNVTHANGTFTGHVRT